MDLGSGRKTLLSKGNVTRPVVQVVRAAASAFGGKGCGFDPDDSGRTSKTGLNRKDSNLAPVMEGYLSRLKKRRSMKR